MSLSIQEIDRNQLPSVTTGVSLFVSKEWAGAYGKGLKAHALTSASGEVMGHFLLFVGSKMGQSYVITPPLAPHIGLTYTVKSEKAVGRLGETKQVHRAIAEYMTALDPGLNECSMPISEQDIQPYQWANYMIRPRYTYHLDLRESNEELLAAMTSERRKNIRKGEQLGLRVERCHDVDEFIKGMQHTFSRADADYNEGIVEQILKYEPLAEHRDLWMGYDNDECCCCALVVRDNDQAYYLVGARDPESKLEGAQAFLLWSALQYAREQGCTIFDLEGSMIADIERFFRGFGGDLKIFYEVRKYGLAGKLWKALK